MNRKEYKTVYAYSVPICLSTSWLSRTLKPCGVATMRRSKSAWLSSPHRRRRLNPVYYQPTCLAKDPKDDGNARDNWFSGLKLWFSSREIEKAKEQKEKEAGASSRTNGVSKDVSSGPENEREVKSAGSDESNQQRVKWPWQQDNDANDATAGVSSEAVKVSKDDSSGQASRENIEQKEEQAKFSLQERFESVTRIIAPGFNPQKTLKRENGVAEKEDEDPYDATDDAKQEAERNPVESETQQDALARDSVRELYQPPRSEEKEEDETGNRDDKRWFRLPWKRKEDSKVESTQDAQAHSPRKKSREKPEVTPERIDTLEQVEVAVEVAREKPPMKSEDTKLDIGKDEDDETVESKVEKEPVLVPEVSEADMNTPIADMMTIPQRDVAEIRLIFGSETFFATETVSMPGGLIFRGNLRGEPKASIAKLEKKLSDRLGEKYTLCLAEGEEDNRPVVVVVPTARDKRPPAPRQKVVSLIVALMAVSTCLGRGFFASILRANIRAVHGPHPRRYMLDTLFDLPSTASVTIAFAVMIIVVLAQVVQRLVAMRHKTRVALPFFLPSYQLGTFGAVVQIASPTPSRSALFDIALAGMVTMVTLSSICLIIGLRMSTTFSSVIPVPMSVVSSSVIIGFLTQQVPDGQILVDYGRSLIGLHPLAVIGANCLTIAALNLLPIRQLDGGRMIGALYGRKTAMTASRVTMLFLLLASSKTPYFIMYLAAVSFGPWSIDRPSKDEITEPNALRTIVGYLFMVVMIGILLPYPACKFFGTV